MIAVLSLPITAIAQPLVINIDAENKNEYQIGTLIGDTVLKKFPKIESIYDNYLDILLTQSQFQQLIPQIKILKDSIDPEYQSEVDAIATSLKISSDDVQGDGKLSVNEFWLLQLLPDLTSIDKGSALAVANRSNRNPVVARNLDWKSISSLRSLQTINVYQYENRTVVTIGFAGLSSVVNGFNDQGLFVSLLDASDKPISTLDMPRNITGFELRTVLKQVDKSTEAILMLTQKSFLRSHEILFADRNNMSVLEQPAGEAGHIRKSDSELVTEMPWSNSGVMVLVNCFVLKISPHNCHDSADFFRWGRFEKLLTSITGRNISADDAILLMQDQVNRRQAIFNVNTLQSMVFTPKDRMLYLYTQPALETDKRNPLVEKYQLIKENTNDSNSLTNFTFLLLGISIIALAWIYVFRSEYRIILAKWFK